MPSRMPSDKAEPEPSAATTATADAPAAHRVVIVGGGFGGLNAAKILAGTGCAVTVVDRTNHTLFQPLLYQVATAALSATSIAVPIRSVFRRAANVSVLMAEVTGVDRQSRTVAIQGHAPIPYDTLVLATGSVYSWFGHDDWAARAPALKSAADALSLRARLLDAFERAETEDDPAAVRRLLTFVVVGAGPTGVEMAGSIAELAHNTLARDFRHIQPSTARIVLCDAGDRVLASFPTRLSDYAVRRLQRIGVELRLGAGVKALDEQGVLAGNERIDAAFVFWAAGTAATPVARWLGIGGDRRGLVAVEGDCSLPGHPEIFVIGDAAALDGPDNKPLPGLGSVAKQQGRHVGRVIAARLRGRPPPGPFRYTDWGQLAVIGRSSAVADFGRIRLTGLPAWLVWSAVHLLLLVSAQNRIAVYVNWASAWLTYSRGARVITVPPPA